MKPGQLSRRLLLTLAGLIVLSSSPPNVSYAENASVLPEGFYQLQMETFFFFEVDTQYNAKGDKEDIATPFNVPLAPLVTQILGTALPPGTDLGTNAFEIKLSRDAFKWTPAYGLTDRLSVGAVIPYFTEADTKFTGTVNTSTANFGINPAAVAPGNPLGLAPLAVPGTRPLNINDINGVLTANGFKPLANVERSGFGDIEVGGRYQYYRSDHLRAAFTGGVRLPTGKKDDPDDLIDQALGDGVWALLFQFQEDVLFGTTGLGGRLGFPEQGTGFVNFNLEYDLRIPDKETLRVCPTSQPICSNRGRIKRDLGDIITAEFSPTVGLLKGVIFSGLYRYIYNMPDDFEDNGTGFDVSVLERNSSEQRHEYKLALSFTTIPWVVEKKFPLPLVFAVTYRDRFAGDNSVNDSKFIGLNVTLYGR